MSLSLQNKALTFDPLPCPECGKITMHQTVEDCVLDDGFKVKKLKHLKCNSCEARFFDDEAMHIVQSVRSATALAA